MPWISFEIEELSFNKLEYYLNSIEIQFHSNSFAFLNEFIKPKIFLKIFDTFVYCRIIELSIESDTFLLSYNRYNSYLINLKLEINQIKTFDYIYTLEYPSPNNFKIEFPIHPKICRFCQDELNQERAEYINDGKNYKNFQFQL